MSSTVRKVLITADTIGGVWVFALELIREFEKLNVEVVLAAMGKKLNMDQFRQISKLKNVILEQNDYKLEWMQDPWADIQQAGYWLIDLENKYSPDIIHLNEYSHSSLPWKAPVILTAHSCVYSWFHEVKGIWPDESWNIYREKVKSGLLNANLVVAPSKTMLEYITRFYVPVNQKLVIYNGRNMQEFHPGEKQPFIFAAGRLWDEAKNIESLALIAPSLGWPVHVAGDYKNPDKNEKYFENINWLGIVPQKKMAELYSHASIYALPAKYEPFGLSILEAAISGCALVLGSIDSLLEIWEGCALFVDPNDPEEIGAGINDMIKDQGFRNRLARLSSERAKNFGASETARQYLKAYKKVMELKTQII